MECLLVIIEFGGMWERLCLHTFPGRTDERTVSILAEDLLKKIHNFRAAESGFGAPVKKKIFPPPHPPLRADRLKIFMLYRKD